MKQEVDFRVAGVCLDVERDLVVLVERKDTPTVLPGGSVLHTITCLLHLFSLSSFSHHPDASRLAISVSFACPTINYSIVIQLGGDHLALLMSKREFIAGADRFFLCNWTNGVGAAYWEAIPHWDTVCFISHYALLLPDTNGFALNIYTFTDDDPGSFVLAASLLLPQKDEDASLMSITARSEPAPRSPRRRVRDHDCSRHTSTPWTYQRQPFTTDPDSAIVVLTMVYIGDANRVQTEQTLVVHRSTLLEHARRDTKSAGSHPTQTHHRVSLEWAAWGPNCTRWGIDGSPWVFSMHGQRLVSMDPVLDPGTVGETTRMMVYDFNMRNAERDVPIEKAQMAQSSTSEHPHMSSDSLKSDVAALDVSGDVGQLVANSGEVGGWPTISRNLGPGGCLSEALNITAQSVISWPAIFENKVVSSLPFRFMCTHEVFDWNRVMIDDERIIGMKEMADDGSMQLLEVIVL
ncbi:hypothetical protein BD410DRAFT_839035 [Rickenella mellea]|uniref:Uncharacterized protein n=1 Tax=Rickenella mellea TaxID=50990 RepID=A0A4Y7Q8Q0_9AGAM|nr:hypothetical protein BD410DRAFT_839035 [Rickenella mellea]